MNRLTTVVIGVSSGGLDALSILVAGLPAECDLSILIAQHIASDSDNYQVLHLQRRSGMRAKEAEDKEPVRPGVIYLAPPNYHLLVEPDQTLSLSSDSQVNFARPSIDVLFESAADCFGERLIGLVMTGANSDGARGLKYIKERGGTAIVQDPRTAAAEAMPRAALASTVVDFVLPLNEIAPTLLRLSGTAEAISKNSMKAEA